MIPLCCGLPAAPIPERAASLAFLSLRAVFSPNITCLMPAVRKKWTGAKHRTLPLLFFSPLSSCPPFLPLLHRLFLSLYRLAHPPPTAFLFLKQISCKCSPFGVFSPLLVGRSFQGNRFLLWPGFCQGLIGLLGTESTKAGELALNGGWEVVLGGLWRWEPVQPENHSQFLCCSVGISR